MVRREAGRVRVEQMPEFLTGRRLAVSGAPVMRALHLVPDNGRVLSVTAGGPRAGGSLSPSHRDQCVYRMEM